MEAKIQLPLKRSPIFQRLFYSAAGWRQEGLPPLAPIPMDGQLPDGDWFTNFTSGQLINCQVSLYILDQTSSPRIAWKKASVFNVNDDDEDDSQNFVLIWLISQKRALNVFHLFRMYLSFETEVLNKWSAKDSLWWFLNRDPLNSPLWTTENVGKQNWKWFERLTTTMHLISNNCRNKSKYSNNN